MRGGDDEHVHI